MNRARFFEQETGGYVVCTLCPHECSIAPGNGGICGTRTNKNGTMVAKSYGRISSLALDPIEKKPLYRFYPHTMILSVGGFGCNMRCPFCQNYDISYDYNRRWDRGTQVSAERLVSLALQTCEKNNIGIAYTYNEPLVGYEFVYDSARLAHKAGLKNVLVTNGYINEKPLAELLPYIDAINIDLKGFSEAFYQRLGARLAPVMRTIERVYQHCHLEVTTLIIPGENDSCKEMEAQAQWLASLDRDIPLHLSRFFPRSHYADRTATLVDSLFDLFDVASRYLTDVSVGNI